MISSRDRELCAIVEQNPLLREVLAVSESLALPQWYIGAGCIVQTVWNHLSGFPLNHGIKDVDFIYYDASDLSAETECIHYDHMTSRLPDFPLELDVNNQARVHLWYEAHFGYKIEPYDSIEQAIATWPTTATATAIKYARGEKIVHAPFGLEDLFSMTARPNKRQITKEIYEEKVTRWLRLWPSLTVIPWD